MTRKLKIAAIQMDATPAPVPERLARAADLIAEAASAGARLAVLPEVFNTGYEYDDRNYGLAERIDGPTVTWMKAQAAQHKIHVAGTLLLLDEEDIFNAALLIAPDGRTWRYDKQYPFLWERTYFREGNRITVADTDLGKMGMMICWDSGHPDLWARYAGKVDLMLVPSCPPNITKCDLVFPDGLRLKMEDLGPALRAMRDSGDDCFGPDMDANAAWLGVPVVSTTAGGLFRSRMPYPALSVGAYLAARPDLWERLSQAPEVMLEADYVHQTKVVDAAGKVLSRVTAPGDGLTLAEIELPPVTPEPKGRQPRMHISHLARLMADVVGAGVGTLYYRQGVRSQLGEHMAPQDPRTRLWMGALAVAATAGWMFGKLRRGERPPAGLVQSSEEKD